MDDGGLLILEGFANEPLLADQLKETRFYMVIVNNVFYLS